MDTKLSYLDEIAPGKIDWRFQARIIHLWNVPNMKNREEVQSIEMLLLDEKSGKIQASVRKYLFPMFRADLQEGSTYLIHKVIVAKNDLQFPKTNHNYRLVFMSLTRVTGIRNDAISLNHFNFVDFPTLHDESTSHPIVDVIGHVVEKDTVREVVKDGVVMSNINIVLEDLQRSRLNCTLWGDYADTMQTYFESLGDISPVIVILQLCRINKFQGSISVSNAFNGSKLLINDDCLLEFGKYRDSLDGSSLTLTPALSQVSGQSSKSIADDLFETPMMTISDLLESPERCFGATLARVVDFDNHEGWVYYSCNWCFKRVTLSGATYDCGSCRTSVSATPRFKLQLQVIDHTGSTSFTVFDSIVAKYIGKSAKAVIRGFSQGHDSHVFPSEFQSFIGKQFLFKVEVSDGNVSNGWQSFTVNKMSSDDDLIQKFVGQHGINVSHFEDEDGCFPCVANPDSIPSLPSLDFVDPSTQPSSSSSLATIMKSSSTKVRGRRAVPAVDVVNLDESEFPSKIPRRNPKGVIVKKEGK